MDNVLNNALNLFPVTQTPQQAQVKLQKLTQSSSTNNRGGPTEIQRILATSLYDDGVVYMNTLDMNRAASYTFGYRSSYGHGQRNGGTTAAKNAHLGGMMGGTTHHHHGGESVADEMWELLVDMTLIKYAQHSPLALTKTINLIQHVLLHGSESCVMDGEMLYKIEMAVEPLRNLNTALVEQRILEQILNAEGVSGRDNDVVLSPEGIGHQLSQLGTRASATMLRLRGGSVDRGYPVRTAASKLYGIISNPNNLRQMRTMQQPGDSLVPIGSVKHVGYITDEGRYRILQEKMAVEERAVRQKQRLEQQRMNQTRSNLAGTSATDSFGGGYTSNAAGGGSGGKLVVGAAHSLADMIESARYQLEQHKTRHDQKISSLKRGYSDDPSARAQRLEELERNRVESDPEFMRKEKALQDALEYLEEMQRLEQEKVGDLLDGVLLGSDNDGMRSGGTAFGNNADGADLLGFDGSAAPRVDVFGGGPSSFAATGNLGADASADLLGFGGLNSGGPTNSPQPIPTNSTVSGYVVGESINLAYNASKTHVGGIAGNSISFNMRPSLVTGIIGGAANGSNPSGVLASPHLPSMGGVHGTMQDEEAEAEKSRKIHLAEGLFAGVIPAVSASAQQKKPIMHSENNSTAWAFDDLIPISDTSLNPSAAAFHSSAFVASGLTSLPIPSSSDMFGIEPAPPQAMPIPSLSDMFGMGPMGGSAVALPPPSMPPPPPPMPPPSMPPPPPPTTTTFATPNAESNLFGNNPSVEQMQEMIKQQQAQMNQMMQLMQQMQMQGSSNNNSNK